MNELKVHDFHGKQVIDSRDVAEMVGRNHNELLKTIRSYCDYLDQGEIAQVDFFIESTYTDTQNRTYPNFLVTKKGCDVIANKTTGKKGVLFTAAYVTAFEEMRQALTAPLPRRVPEISPGGLAKLILATRKVMLEAGSSPLDVREATKSIYETWCIPVPPGLSKQLPGQLCLFNTAGVTI